MRSICTFCLLITSTLYAHPGHLHLSQGHIHADSAVMTQQLANIQSLWWLAGLVIGAGLIVLITRVLRGT